MTHLTRLECFINWRVQLPQKVINLEATALYFLDRGVMMDWELCTQLLHASASFFKRENYVSIGVLGEPLFKLHQIIDGEKQSVLKQIMELSDFYNFETPVVFFNESFDWCLYDDLKDEFAILVFRCEKNKVENFLNYLVDLNIFDWSVLLNFYSVLGINRGDYWDWCEKIALDSPKHQNIGSVTRNTAQS
jgi:hypothetical protein